MQELVAGKTYKTVSGTIVNIHRKGRKYFIGTVHNESTETTWWPDGTHTRRAGLRIEEEINLDTRCILRDMTILWKKEHNSFLRKKDA